MNKKCFFKILMEKVVHDLDINVLLIVAKEDYNPPQNFDMHIFYIFRFSYRTP